MGLTEPASLLQSVRKYQLELWGEHGQGPFGAGKACRVSEGSDGGLDLFVGYHRRVNTGRIRPSAVPASAPPTAAPMLADSSATESSTSTLATT